MTGAFTSFLWVALLGLAGALLDAGYVAMTSLPPFRALWVCCVLAGAGVPALVVGVGAVLGVRAYLDGLQEKEEERHAGR